MTAYKSVFKHSIFFIGTSETLYVLAYFTFALELDKQVLLKNTLEVFLHSPLESSAAHRNVDLDLPSYFLVNLFFFPSELDQVFSGL